MSCFSCFSGKQRQLDDIPPPARRIRHVTDISATVGVEKVVIQESTAETTEVTFSGKEVDVLAYDSDSDSVDLEIDVEKRIAIKKHLVRRGVLPSKFKSKSKKGQFMIAVHNTGEELQLRLNRQRMIDSLSDPMLRASVIEQERQRQAKWQADRYGC